MTVKCMLFDLDGTLVTTGGAGIRTLEKAFFSLYNIPKAMREVDPAGKTDPAIIREIFGLRLGRNCSRKEMESVQEKYLEFLPEACAQSRRYRVMPGVQKLLAQLHRKNVVLGLGTGNLERGARIKLNRAELNNFFPFGGFGSDSEDRAELLKIARRRAERFAGTKLCNRNIFVVGDTARDIRAARRAQFKVIAVATGHTTAKELKKMAPDFFAPNFELGEDFLKIVCNHD